MNVKWKNEKELTRHNARRYDGQGNNPVRDYSLVEKKNNPTMPRMPSGMRPADSNGVAFLRNARNRVGYNCYQATFPTGMGRYDEQGDNPVRDYSLVEKRNNLTTRYMPSGMRPANRTPLVANN